MKKSIVRFTPEQQTSRLPMIRRGQAAARTLLPARLLRKADRGPAAPAGRDQAIREALAVQEASVARVRQRLVEEGLKAA